MRGVNVVALYGGQRYDVRLRALRQGPQIVVGTPGRLLDRKKRGTSTSSKTGGLVLDEADEEILRMGFIETLKLWRRSGRSSAEPLCLLPPLCRAIRRITRRFMKSRRKCAFRSA